MPLFEHSDFIGVVPEAYRALQPSFDNLFIFSSLEGNGTSVLEVWAKTYLLFAYKGRLVAAQLALFILRIYYRIT